MIEHDVKKLNAQKEIDRLARDYKDLFGSDKGKKVLADLEQFCGYNKSSVYEQSPDALQTMFAEGKRRVYLRILWYLNREIKE